MANTNINYNSFFTPKPNYIPGAFLDQIELSNVGLGKQSGADRSSNLGFNVSIDYHTYFIGTNIDRYFEGNYKVAIFYMTSEYEGWSAEGSSLATRASVFRSGDAKNYFEILAENY